MAPPSLSGRPPVAHLGRGAAVGAVPWRQVGDDEAVEPRAVDSGGADPAQGQLLHLPAQRALGHVGHDGVGEARHHHII